MGRTGAREVVTVRTFFTNQHRRPERQAAAARGAFVAATAPRDLPLYGTQPSDAASLPSAACAAASRAIGTRNGEHDT